MNERRVDMTAVTQNMDQRCLVVQNCMQCPNHDHKGAFGAVAYVPVCRKVGLELPYDPVTVGPRGSVTASPKGTIPDWCPLEPRINHNTTSVGIDTAIGIARIGAAIAVEKCKDATGLRNQIDRYVSPNQCALDTLDRMQKLPLGLEVPPVPDSRIMEIVRGFIADRSDKETRPDMNDEHNLLALCQVIADEAKARSILWQLELTQ